MKIYLDKKINQINMYDRRYYHIEDTDIYYPSATTILGFYPKTEQFYQYLRDTSNNSHQILRRAGYEGSLLHDSLEEMLNGETLEMIDEYGNEKFPLIVWKCLVKASQFLEYVDEVLDVEGRMLSTKLELAGTRDMIAVIDGETWLIDWKSSNNVQKTWPIQLALYKEMSEEEGFKIDRVGVVWLKSSHRTEKGFNQGIGWKLLEYTKEHDKSMEIYRSLRNLWNVENPDYRPHNLTLPNSLMFYRDVKKSEQSKKTHRNKEVQNFSTGEIYTSIKEASKHEDLKYGSLCRMLNGKIHNKTDLILI